MLLVTKEFTFDAAHNLVKYHGKCERLHGHTYKLIVTVAGEKDEEGMVIDFIELKNIVKENVLNILDHSYINDIIEQPSAENIAEWIWERLIEKLKTDRYFLYEVKLYETPTSYVTLRRNLDV
ncbi:6-pyruvoyl tetrahydropterin synthase [Thermosipho sp. 1063]|uniref:6-carboxytetrahydropterin synthase QueD n=1 Tax=unclassified Thermosipho (in: thermotogales) TaxID=2676525 RepID=UPI0009493D2C|nr:MULTISPECIES: 6-carboxytetrahydropterin synthase QueD [unclassified Thermosipho (in: thermotogales)]ANQ54174.1 6-pyruvoyl tetrahydropterin synthase [Thermosipho sp. 1070]APT72619.1 6-pyruvoyl tetrahydropterin synthase [Thermosipho sp. 1063]OOC42431.1 6-pyruvoyl tetrahydropterin synthase [Thermosipho sp. 1074]